MKATIFIWDAPRGRLFITGKTDHRPGAIDVHVRFGYFGFSASNWRRLADALATHARGNDVGTVVLVHGEGAAFDVEFVGYDGHTVALLTLEAGQVRALRDCDIPHARTLGVA